MPSRNPISYTNTNGTPFNSSAKAFFVSDTTGATYNTLCLNYPPDPDGTPRVFTTVTLALAACVSGEGDFIVLSPDFSTALTAAELLSAETKGVVIIQGGLNVGQTWRADRASANLPQTTSSAIFTVTGKVKLRGIQATVMNSVQDQAATGQLVAFDTTSAALGSTSLSAAGSIRNNKTSAFWGITGTLATALQTSAVAGVYQAAALTIAGGTSIRFKTSASNYGKVKWRVEYEPLEPGARIFAA